MGISPFSFWAIPPFLDEDQSFANRLAQRLRNQRVDNGAVPGFGTVQSIILMKRLLQQRKFSHVVLGYADYLMARDSGQLNWALPLAEMSSLDNISVPFGEVIDGTFVIRPSQPYFVTFPGRTVLSSVRAVEVGLAALGSIRRWSKRDEAERGVLLTWAKAVADHGAVPVLLLWEGDGALQRNGEALRQAGIKSVSCVHPLLKQSVGRVDPEGHPSAMVVDWWADCLVAGVPSLVGN
jgi:hypothetical protein